MLKVGRSAEGQADFVVVFAVRNVWGDNVLHIDVKVALEQILVPI